MSFEKPGTPKLESENTEQNPNSIEQLVGKVIRERSSGHQWKVLKYDAEKNEVILQDALNEERLQTIPDGDQFPNHIYMYGNWMIDTGSWN
jgi:hypothetical protein